MSLFGGEAGNCPHCDVYVRFQQQHSINAKDNSGTDVGTVLTSICPSCERVVVFIIKGLDEWERFPLSNHQQALEAVLHSGEPHTAYVLIRGLVESATDRFWLADPWMDRSVFDLLSNTKPSAEIRLLTRAVNLPPDFRTELDHFSRQRGGTCKGRDGLTNPHDRYVIVDDRAFLSGASLKHLGMKESVVLRTAGQNEQIVASFESRWATVTPF